MVGQQDRPVDFHRLEILLYFYFMVPEMERAACEREVFQQLLLGECMRNGLTRFFAYGRDALFYEFLFGLVEQPVFAEEVVGRRSLEGEGRFRADFFQNSLVHRGDIPHQHFDFSLVHAGAFRAFEPREDLFPVLALSEHDFVVSAVRREVHSALDESLGGFVRYDRHRRECFVVEFHLFDHLPQQRLRIVQTDDRHVEEDARMDDRPGKLFLENAVNLRGVFIFFVV